MITIHAADFTKQLALDERRLAGLLRNDADKVSIFVPRNSPAGKYAYLQHDVIAGRGAGTRHKGGHAGWKFIERAIDDNIGKVTQLIEDGWNRVLDSWGKGRQMRKALSEVGRIVQREARRYAKRSPTNAQIRADRRSRKTLEALMRAGKRRLKPVSKLSRKEPGGLEKSIKYEVS